MLIEALNSEASNVVALFGHEEVGVDPLQTLLDEAEMEAWGEESLESPIEKERIMVLSHQAPDQSIYVLEKQLEALKGSLGRLNFYINDIQDILPI